MTTPAPEATPAAPAPAPAPPAAPSGKMYSQEEVEQLIKDRVTRIKGGEEADKRFADLEKTVKDTQALLQKEADRAVAAEKRAIDTQVAGLLSEFHDGTDKFLDLEGVTVDNVADKVGPQLDKLRTERAYLVKAAEAAAPGAAPAAPKAPAVPGAGAPPVSGVLSKAQRDALSVEDLAKDKDLMTAYLASMNAEQGV